MQRKSRIPGLDLMKCLGLYLVVLYHLTWRDAPDIMTGGGRTILYFFLSTFASICVPLFFAASGALSLTRPVDLRRNTLRCVHLVALIVFWTLVELPTVFLLRGEHPSLREAAAVVVNLSSGYVQHLWYLPTFLFFTLLMPLVRSLRDGSRRVYLYGLVVVGIFSFGNTLLSDGEYLLRWATGHLGYSGTRQYFWYTNFFAYHYWWALIYLALGAELLEQRERLARFRKWIPATVLLCMLALTLIGIAHSHVQGAAFDPIFNNYGDPFTLVMTMAVSLGLLSLQPGGRIQRFAAALSDSSLGIYLVHWILVEAIRRFLPVLMRTLWLSPLTAVAVLAASWGITWVCRKIPLLRELFTASPRWIKRFETPAA